MLSRLLISTVEHLLSQSYADTTILSTAPVGGGCIHQAYKIETTNGPFFIKWNSHLPPGIFTSEAHGLSLLRDAGAVRTPEVIFISDNASVSGLEFILMEWIDSVPQGYDPALLGEKLAALHCTLSPTQMVGLNNDNFIGMTPQINHWSVNWVEFFRDNRLAYQIELAKKNGRMPPKRLRKLETLTARLDEFLAKPSPPPSLLHGDLWTGNILGTTGGEPCLIDPAVYYGDREAELAYTELFGGFSERFYQAYQSVLPLEPGYNKRRDIYNLYHLLNHLNIFGEQYGFQIDSILRSYLG